MLARHHHPNVYTEKVSPRGNVVAYQIANWWPSLQLRVPSTVAIPTATGVVHSQCLAGGAHAQRVFYMEKIAVGPDAADAIDITAPVAEN
jgi:hypothetical protein